MTGSAKRDRAALLRAINVGGRSIAMADLRGMFAQLELGDPLTLLQSGNVAFAGGRRSNAELERLLERAIEERFGIRSDCFVRDRAALRDLIANNPFAREAKTDPGRLHAFFLKEAPDRKAAAAFLSAWSGIERVHVDGAHAYVYYPEGAGRSKFKIPWLATARNWNTTIKLLALLE